MRYFENVLLMRRAFDRREGTNAYRIHCFVEETVVDQRGIHSPYSYCFRSDSANNQAIIFTRSAVSIGLPGEREKELIITGGEQVNFIVSFHTSKRLTGSSKVIAVTDEEQRLEKLVKIAAKNGFEILSAQQVDDCSMKLKKKQNAFSLAGGLFYVQAKISDKGLFEQAFINGIGRKRNFGFGQIRDLEVIHA